MELTVDIDGRFVGKEREHEKDVKNDQQVFLSLIFRETDAQNQTLG